jgi:hypothetical protein
MGKPEPVCKNCLLYNRKEGTCEVRILQEGEKYELSVLPDDRCHWLEMDIPVHQIRAWSDGKDGYIETTE